MPTSGSAPRSRHRVAGPKRCLARRTGRSLATGFETGPGLGVGTRPGAGRHGAEGVVEAQVSSGRARRGGPRRRVLPQRCGAGDVGQLTHRARSGLVAKLPVGLGGGHIDHGPHLVEGHLARTERPHQVRQVAGLLADVGQCPGGRLRDPEALRRPGFSRSRSVVSERLAAVGLAQAEDDLPSAAVFS